MTDRETRDAVRDALDDLPIEVSAVMAVGEIESNWRAFEPDGSPARRFEPHHLKPISLRKMVTGRDRWTWRDSLAMSGPDRNRMYAFALNIDPEATHYATSYGVGQTMGFNAKAVGYSSASEMFHAYRDFGAQVRGMVEHWRQSPGALDALAAKDWLEFARINNGSGQPEKYAAKLQRAYMRIKGSLAPQVLRLGARGKAVEEYQRGLTAAGFETPDDGVFGPVTDKQTRAFQAARGLPVDGVAGSRTLRKLYDIGAQPVPPLAQPTRTGGTGKTDVIGGGSAVVIAVEAGRVAMDPDRVAQWSELLGVSPLLVLGGALVLAIGVFAWPRILNMIDGWRRAT